MLFNSLEFLFFFAIVTALYFVFPHRFRWILLLAASCYFYMAFVPVYILILGFTIVIDYIAGIVIENAEGSRRKLWLSLSLIANIGVLAVFKYYNFLNDNLTALLGLAHVPNPVPYLSILLPIGLSFHTFQAMSYTIEVYRGNQKAERHFGIYALYVMFYPQLVAGPIERPQNVLHQFHEKHFFDYNLVTGGLRMMLWGFFKKIVIADRLSLFTDPVFNHPHDYPGPTLFIAACFFSFQIFCDFSGYSDIALGSARVMGFELMKNFDRPYLAKTMAEFWSRWHISLSTWFRDYLYFPLGGNRRGKWITYRNRFIVFMTSGLWHGANWTFIVWGALHGFYLIFADITQAVRYKISAATGLTRFPGLYHFVQVATVFFLATFAWIFFRASSLADSWYIITHLHTGWAEMFREFRATGYPALQLVPSFTHFAAAIFFVAFMETVHHLQNRYAMQDIIRRLPGVLRWGLYYAAFQVILVMGVYESKQFIYFQF
jgi:alginate O-acetyltransferase complex protein AlgI